MGEQDDAKAQLRETRKQTVAECRAKWGKVSAFIHLESDELIVVRAPNRMAHTRFVDVSNDPRAKESRGTALHQLSIDSIANLDIPRLRELLDKWPGVADEIASRALELAKGQVEEFEGN